MVSGFLYCLDTSADKYVITSLSLSLSGCLDIFLLLLILDFTLISLLYL